jgi:IS30 family transposase
MTSIDDRPAEVAGRQVPGHWEGDLIIGKQGKTALGTLVERTTRYFIPVALPKGRDSGAVLEAVIGSIGGVPAHLRKSITWDHGT